jgi:hypothetical protein
MRAMLICSQALRPFFRGGRRWRIIELKVVPPYPVLSHYTLLSSGKKIPGANERTVARIPNYTQKSGQHKAHM